MGNEAGVGKLKGSMSAYGSAAGSGAPQAGIIEPGKGFELKSGSNGRSSGPALPISKSPTPDQTYPGTDGDDKEAQMSEEDSDEASIIEPSKGYPKD